MKRKSILIGLSAAELLAMIFIPYWVGMWNPFGLLTSAVWITGLITIALVMFVVCWMVAFFIFNNVIAEEDAIHKK